MYIKGALAVKEMTIPLFLFFFQNLSMAWEYVLLTNKDIYFVQTEEKPS